MEVRIMFPPVGQSRDKGFKHGPCHRLLHSKIECTAMRADRLRKAVQAFFDDAPDWCNHKPLHPIALASAPIWGESYI
jgi:hypothetical protein